MVYHIPPAKPGQFDPVPYFNNVKAFLQIKLMHTVNLSSDMIGALYISGKNIFGSTHVYKNRERKFFEILHCPFELPANQHRPFGQYGLIGQC